MISWQFVFLPEVEKVPDGAELRFCFKTADAAFSAERQISKDMGLGKPGMTTQRYAEPTPWLSPDGIFMLSRQNALALSFAIAEEIPMLRAKLPNDPDVKDSIDRVIDLLTRLRVVADQIVEVKPFPRRQDWMERELESWQSTRPILVTLDELVGKYERTRLLSAGFRGIIFLICSFVAVYGDPMIGTLFAGAIATGVDPTKMVPGTRLRD
jgi:hypothetical protein